MTSLKIQYSRFSDFEHCRPDILEEPKRFIFTFWMGCDFETVSIIEIAPVMYGGEEKFIFPTQEEFDRIVAFHLETNNYCPYLGQSWLAGYDIDMWESYSDWKIYNTAEECVAGAELYAKKCIELRSKDEEETE